jgi:hypothetical protein
LDVLKWGSGLMGVLNDGMCEWRPDEGTAARLLDSETLLVEDQHWFLRARIVMTQN